VIYARARAPAGAEVNLPLQPLGIDVLDVTGTGPAPNQRAFAPEACGPFHLELPHNPAEAALARDALAREVGRDRHYGGGGFPMARQIPQHSWQSPLGGMLAL